MIKNVIFDIGRILLGYQWDYVLQMSGLSKEDAYRVGMMIFDDPLWHEMDAGNISMAEAVKQYRSKYPEEDATISYFLEHADQMPVPRERVWDKVRELKEKGCYKLYVLSNYGKEIFEMHTADTPFMSYMDGGVISYELHLCKPDRGIYEALLNKYQLNPEECIFFDDRIENIEGAQKLGITGVHITEEEQLIAQIDKLLEI